ncbi:MAG: protein-L-isoaspartate O-methyltransferase family protein [Pseudomarimonas sp.]
MPLDFATARRTMVEQQVRPWDVLDPRVLATIGSLHREDFVGTRHRKLAYADIELPLEHGESMLKPIIEGRILQALDLAPEHDVLEVGTGSGYLTACLAQLTRAVLSIDVHNDFVERARVRLESISSTCVRLQTADALNFDPGRQFDAVAVTGAVATVPSRFLDWVRPGGRLFVIRGVAPVQEAVLMTRLENGAGWSEESLFETDVAYLRGAAPLNRFVL